MSVKAIDLTAERGRMAGARCDKCLFGEFSVDTPHSEQPIHCRRGRPGFWAWVGLADWCGEFISRAPEEEA